MTEADKKVILDLYGIVSRNLRQHGRSMRFGSDLILCCQPDEDGLFDPDDLEDLSCREFIFACYMRLLGRIPERTLNTYPTRKDPVPIGRNKEYDARVLPTFIYSDEFRLFHEVEEPPRPAPPPPPSLRERFSTSARGVLKRITPLFIRKILNSAFRHD